MKIFSKILPNDKSIYTPYENGNYLIYGSDTSIPFNSGLDRSLSHLQNTLSLSLEEKLEKQLYVADIPCGGGKTEAFCQFIKNWKHEGFPGSGSILIALATKDEIDAVRARCGLDLTDFAVVTSDHKLNKYGLGYAGADRTKVLFTTHEQYILRVVEAKSFDDAAIFHYHGRPRSLRIWDEAFPFATPASFNLWAWQSLPSALRIGFHELAKAIDALIPHRESLTPGYAIDVPAWCCQSNANPSPHDAFRSLNAVA